MKKVLLQEEQVYDCLLLIVPHPQFLQKTQTHHTNQKNALVKPKDHLLPTGFYMNLDVNVPEFVQFLLRGNLKIHYPPSQPFLFRMILITVEVNPLDLQMLLNTL